MIGLVSLGVFGLLALGVLTVVSALARRERVWLPGLAGVIASLMHLVLWGVLSLLAPRDLTLTRDLLALGVASLVYGLAVLAIFVAAGAIRRRALGEVPARQGTTAIGAAVGVLSDVSNLLDLMNRRPRIDFIPRCSMAHCRCSRYVCRSS